MYKCENCLETNSIKFASGRFCSRSCSNSFSTKSKRNEINEKVSEKLKGRKNIHSEETKANIAKKVSLHRREKYANKDFDEVSLGLKKRRILLEQNNQCLSCKMSTWLGEPIKFELDHIDGNRKNNVRDNLRILCPNCHSLTPTWKKKKTYIPE